MYIHVALYPGEEAGSEASIHFHKCHKIIDALCTKLFKIVCVVSEDSQTNHQLLQSKQTWYCKIDQWDLSIMFAIGPVLCILAITDRWLCYTGHFCTGPVQLGPEVVTIIMRWLLKIIAVIYSRLYCSYIVI